MSLTYTHIILYLLLSQGPLAWKNLVKEDRKGAASIFVVKCHFRGYLNTASTSMQHRTGKWGPMAHDVNTRLALGALNAGIGHTHVNSLLLCLDIPTVNHLTFKTREREVRKAVEHEARKVVLRIVARRGRWQWQGALSVTQRICLG